MKVNLEKIVNITKAAALGDACFTYILGEINVGMREKEVADLIDAYLLSHGGEALAFPTICVSGACGSEPHGVPSEKKIESGDLVTMDFGAVVGGYCGDMTRTVAVGKPSAEMKKVYEVVLAAQFAGIAALAPGAKCKAVDAAARDVIAAAGYGEYYVHGTGHGVGQEVHEAPTLNPKSKESLKAGQAVTVEPGIYIPGTGGCRIEDLLIITETGTVNLVASEKQLIVV
ncbi:MAG: aminopeptidase P family protein [Clostridiales Family XIII bacterium]|jgi:Xaa-Pro aminopeptidase|nr:aminopeptidase P family protein [Clostridiales Family XIII bacterium]